MTTAYEIVRISRDKTEQTIATVLTLQEIDCIVESPQYVGTWLNDTRKLLRYGLGEIHVRKVKLRPQVADHAFTEHDGQMTVLLNIRYGIGLDWIRITNSYIAGYNLSRTRELWRVTNLVNLRIHLDKDLAYVCIQLYDKLLDSCQLEGAM